MRFSAPLPVSLRSTTGYRASKPPALPTPNRRMELPLPGQEAGLSAGLVAAQIQREREVGAGGGQGRHEHRPRRVAEGAEAGEAAPLGFVGVDRHCSPVPAPGAGDVVDASAEGAPGPAVDPSRTGKFRLSLPP